MVFPHIPLMEGCYSPEMYVEVATPIEEYWNTPGGSYLLKEAWGGCQKQHKMAIFAEVHTCQGCHWGFAMFSSAGSIWETHVFLQFLQVFAAFAIEWSHVQRSIGWSRRFRRPRSIPWWGQRQWSYRCSTESTGTEIHSKVKEELAGKNACQMVEWDTDTTKSCFWD